MSYEEFADKMREIANCYDTEGGHVEADALLCEALRSLGYEEGVQIFESLDKWYA